MFFYFKTIQSLKQLESRQQIPVRVWTEIKIMFCKQLLWRVAVALSVGVLCELEQSDLEDLVMLEKLM